MVNKAGRVDLINENKQILSKEFFDNNTFLTNGTVNKLKHICWQQIANFAGEIFSEKATVRIKFVGKYDDADRDGEVLEPKLQSIIRQY